MPNTTRKKLDKLIKENAKEGPRGLVRRTLKLRYGLAPRKKRGKPRYRGKRGRR